MNNPGICCQVAATVLAKFSSLTSTSTIPVLRMVNALEHVGPVVVDVLAELASSHRDSGLLKEVLREISRSGSEESKDSAGVRNVADFLVACSDRLSKELLANLVTLLPHLDGPSYPMRSAIVTSLGTIIANVFPGDKVGAPTVLSSLLQLQAPPTCSDTATVPLASVAPVPVLMSHVRPACPCAGGQRRW